MPDAPEINDAALGRRAFLGVAAGAATLAACTREDSAEKGLKRIRAGGGDWGDVHALFDKLSDEWIEMSTMLIASHPKPVRDAIAMHRKAIDETPAVYVQGESRKRQDAVRLAAARYVGGVDHDDIALTDSTTQGVALVLQGLTLKTGQEVLTTDRDYFVTHESLRLKAAITGATERRIALYDDIATVSADALVDRVIGEVRPNTRALALTWVHSSTGLKIPAAAIGAAVARINEGRAPDDRLLFCLNSVHGFGNQDEDFSAIGCDFMMAGCHKWLFGPRGTGVIVGKTEAWPQLTPLFPSFADDGAYGRWMRGEPALPTTAAMVQPGGFKPFEHVFALNEAFDLHRQVGRAKIKARTDELAAQLKEGLAGMGHVVLKTPRSSALSAGIVSFDIEGMNPWDAVEALRVKKTVASVAPYRTPHVRLTPSIRNTPRRSTRCWSRYRRCGGWLRKAPSLQGRGWGGGRALACACRKAAHCDGPPPAPPLKGRGEEAAGSATPRTMTDIPEGFIELPFKGGFIGAMGPLYARRGPNSLNLGFRVEDRHCNPMGMCHGGWLATFADMQLPFAARAQAGLARRFLPTISLTTDYLAPAKLGGWVEGRTEVLRVTRTILFAQMTASADGELCLRANGIFKLGQEVPGFGAFEKLLENRE